MHYVLLEMVAGEACVKGWCRFRKKRRYQLYISRTHMLTKADNQLIKLNQSTLSALACLKYWDGYISIVYICSYTHQKFRIITVIIAEFNRYSEA